ncbi:hypothetical protein [Enterococcus alcedinis]|uniref:hypothetical protein n=1 Tax=Enterococcus alcedinis TaxID=1274384 RepID=UPI00166EF5D0|nr:hypothetical protein [Enterococcus alcedinis]MBP2102763.1 hypothetical protein [Enterococcus alcedinis]
MNKIIKKSYEIKDVYFFLGIVLLTITVFFSPEYINPIKKYIGVIAVILFLAKISLSEYTKKEYIIAFFCGVILCISTYFSGREALLMSYFAILSSKNVEIRSIFKTIFWVGLISLITSIAVYLSVDGFSQSLLESRQFFGIEVSVSKNSLGYSHANMLYLLMFVLTSIYGFLKFKTLGVIDYVAILLVSIAFFAITFSRTGIVVSLASIIILYILKRSNRDSWIYKAIPYIPLILLVLSFVLPLIYNVYPNGIMHILNRTLSDRIYYSAEFLRVAKQTFFGTDVHGLLGGENDFPLRADNSFVLILRAYGYINFIILSFLTFKISRQEFKKEEWYIIIIMYLYCFTEGFFVIAVQNVSLFILSKKYFKYTEIQKNLLGMLWRKSIE